MNDLAGDDVAIARLDVGRHVARQAAWRAGATPAAVGDPPAGPLCIDLDATLVTSHSDKESTAETYKRAYGPYPLLAYL